MRVACNRIESRLCTLWLIEIASVPLYHFLRFVPEIYDAEVRTSFRTSTTFIALPLYECSLDVWVERRLASSLTESNWLIILLGMLDAIVMLDYHGVTHRDIKSANFCVTSDGRVVLIDFGGAMFTTDSSGLPTAFVAQEQARCLSGISWDPLIRLMADAIAAFRSPDRPATLKELYAKCDLWGVGRTLMTCLIPDFTGEPWNVCAQLIVVVLPLYSKVACVHALKGLALLCELLR